MVANGRDYLRQIIDLGLAEPLLQAASAEGYNTPIQTE